MDEGRGGSARERANVVLGEDLVVDSEIVHEAFVEVGRPPHRPEHVLIHPVVGGTGGREGISIEIG